MTVSGQGWRILALLLAVLPGLAERSDRSPVRVGVINRISNDTARNYAAGLVEYLGEQIPGRRFIVVPFLNNEDAALAAGRGDLDFLYITSAVFARLEVEHGATPIAAALVELPRGGLTKHIGGVIFCRAGRAEIQRLGDLRRKRVVGCNPTALGGWLAALREFKDEGLVPDRDFASMRFARSPIDTAEAVLEGSADAGVVSITEFARLATSPRYSREQFHVLPPRISYPELELVSAAASTRAYPGTPFVRMRHVPDQLAKEVAMALYRMPRPSAMNRFLNVAGWSLPMNYQPVRDCLRELNLPPYDRIERQTISRAIERNWRSILLIVSIVAAILAGSTMLAVIARHRLSRSQKILIRQASLLEQTSDGVFAVDAEYHITFWNRAAGQLCGLSPKQVLGLRPDEVIPGVGARQEHDEAKRKLESEGSWQGRIQVRRPDGALREVEVAATAIFGPDLRMTAAVAGMRDVTERKSLEEQLLQSQKMQAVGLLAGGVAHDFNNLLTVINGYAEIALVAARTNGVQARHLEQILSAGRRAAELTQQLLAFSRKQVLQPRPIDLNSLLNEMGHLLRRLIGEDIELSVHPAMELPLIQADPGQVQQVIMNLVVNAREATPSGGRISLSTAPVEAGNLPAELRGVASSGFVQLLVADTGVGMDDAVMKRIFEPFFTTKELGKGTGLGLSTVYGIVRQSGGHIEVSSAPGQGTCFTVYLPCAASQS
jgi:PAS domain S-box-containing protein